MPGRAMLTVTQDNYARWRWIISGRADGLPDAPSAMGFDTREQALENAYSVLGEEADLAELSMDGFTGGEDTPVPPLPKVDAREEAMRAGLTVTADDPNVGMGLDG